MTDDDLVRIEGVAAFVLDDLNAEIPVDFFKLADDEGFEVKPGPAGKDKAAAVGNRIYYDPTLRPEKQRWDVGHELSHHWLREHGLQDTEPACQSLTARTLMPSDEFGRDLRRHGPDPWALKRIHRHASHEAIGRRVVSIEPSVLWVWDEGPDYSNRYCVVTPRWRWPYRRYPTAIEMEALDVAADSEPETRIEIVGGIVSWLVVDGPWRRRLSLADGEVLVGYV